MPVALLERGLPRDTTVNPRFKTLLWSRIGCVALVGGQQPLQRRVGTPHALRGGAAPSAGLPERVAPPHRLFVASPPYCGVRPLCHYGSPPPPRTRFVRGCVAVIRVGHQPTESAPPFRLLTCYTHAWGCVLGPLWVCVDTCISRRVGASHAVVGEGAQRRTLAHLADPSEVGHPQFI